MYINMYGSDVYGYSEQQLLKWQPTSSASPIGAAFFFVSFVLIGTMIVLNLVIGVIMNSMDESNAEMSIKQEMERRNKNPEPIRDGLHDLQKSLEELSEEMKVIKKMIEEKAKQLSKTFSYIDKPMHMSAEALLLPKLDKFSILNLLQKHGRRRIHL